MAVLNSSRLLLLVPTAKEMARLAKRPSVPKKVEQSWLNLAAIFGASMWTCVPESVRFREAQAQHKILQQI